MPANPRVVSARRYNLPPDYSLACRNTSKKGVAVFWWTKPHAQSPKDEPFSTPDDAVRAAWADAGLPAPEVLSVSMMKGVGSAGGDIRHPS